MSMETANSGNYTAITTATTTVIRNGPGRLLGFFVGAGTTPTVQIYDNNAASGTQIVPTTASLNPGWYECPANFNTGLTVVTGGTTPSVTVIWLGHA
jgi:glutamine amidotransferase-like uncharacterized protein